MPSPMARQISCNSSHSRRRPQLEVNISYSVECREIARLSDGGEVVINVLSGQIHSASLSIDDAIFTNHNILHRAISDLLRVDLGVPLNYLHQDTATIMHQISLVQRIGLISPLTFWILEVHPFYVEDTDEREAAEEIERALRESEEEFEMSNNYGMVPADPTAIRLKYVTVENASESCTICMEEFSGGSAASMPCDHFFHRECIVKWLASSHYCPICRYEMPTEAQNFL